MPEKTQEFCPRSVIISSNPGELFLVAAVTGSFMVPLLSGPLPLEVLNAEKPMKFMLEKAKNRHPNFRILEGDSKPATRNAEFMLRWP